MFHSLTRVGDYAALKLQDEMRRYSGKLGAAGNVPIEAALGEHRRSSGPFDCDRRGPRGVRADWPFDQPRGADAGDGTDRLDPTSTIVWKIELRTLTF